MKVRNADNRATPTASGPSSLIPLRLAAGATRAASALAACSTLIEPCQRMVKTAAANNQSPVRRRPPELMLLYNNVAELRQNRGIKTTVGFTEALVAAA